MDAPIYVVVCSYGAPETMLKADGTRYGPLAMETDIEGATIEKARERAAMMERCRDYGACRVARLVFEDHPGFAA